MNDQEIRVPRKAILIGVILFAVLFWLTVSKIFRNIELGHLRELALGGDVRFFLLGVGCMLVYAFMEGLNFWRILHISGYPHTVFQCFRYAATGIFFNAITPSASGGQPMQILAMRSDGIHISHGTFAIFNNLLGYQISAVTLSVTGLILNRDVLLHGTGGLAWILVIGILSNALLAAGIAAFIFSPAVTGKLAGGAIRAAGKLFPKLGDMLLAKLRSFTSEYGDCAAYIRSHPAGLLTTVLISLVQVSAMFAVPYFAYRFLGVSEVSFAELFLLQAVIFVGVGLIPLPGAMGVNEITTLAVYQNLFSEAMVSDGAFVSRTISLYLWIAVYGIMVVVWAIRLWRRRSPVKQG